MQQREGRLVDCKHEMRMRSRESGDAMDGDAIDEKMWEKMETGPRHDTRHATDGQLATPK